MEMPGMSASIVAKRTGIRPATGNTRKRIIGDNEQRHSITFLFSFALLFKYRQRGWQNLQIVREQFTANMLDIFCLKCLLHKQTLQGLPAYLNIKHPRYVLKNKRSYIFFNWQNDNVIRTLYNISITSLLNFILPYKNLAILTSFRRPMKTLCFDIYIF